MTQAALITLVLRAVALLMQVRQDGSIDEIRRQAQDLIDELRSGLPAKPDGSPWTREDIERLAADHYALTAALRARHTS